QALFGEPILFDIEVAHRHRDVEVAGVVEDGTRDRERRDDARGRVRLGPSVLAAKLELYVVRLIEPRAVCNDVGVAPRSPPPVGRRDDPAVRSEREVAVVSRRRRLRLGRRDRRRGWRRGISRRADRGWWGCDWGGRRFGFGGSRGRLGFFGLLRQRPGG